MNLLPAEPLDELESWVVELFSSVKKGLQVKQEIGVDIPIWKSGKLYRLEAVKDVHVLDLSWTLPSLRKDYMKKSEEYLSHLLGHGTLGLRVHRQLMNENVVLHIIYFLTVSVILICLQRVEEVCIIS